VLVFSLFASLLLLLPPSSRFCSGSWQDAMWRVYVARMQIPVAYPVTNPELCLPELEGKTAKMYRYATLATATRVLGEGGPQ
jgi:hypothetical protein